MKAYFVEQADYQRWACEELFRSLDTLTEEQRRQDCGLFFKDIHKTVDHMLIVVRNWRARLSGDFDNVTGYSELLFDDWEQLKQALSDEFVLVGEWLSAQSEDWFTGSISYPGSGGKKREAGIADGLIHIMTHTVHHRGQISTVCTQMSAPSPEMDFVFYRWRAGK
jgi:uncharacterized damage-inducible protein DinB